VYPTTLTDAYRSQLKVGSTVKGVIAGSIQSNSPAAVMGLNSGNSIDIITGINGTPVSDLAGFYKTLREKATTELWFEVSRGGKTLETMRYKIK
jgi:S1-C subfamily serine protease